MQQPEAPNPRLIAKVQKLLALAGNTTFENEAHEALLKAQALLVEHGLSMEDLGSTNKPEQVDLVDLETLGARTISWKSWLTSIIAKNFRCQGIVNTTRPSKKSRVITLRFIGLTDDVAIARQTYLATVAAIERLSSAYVATRKREGTCTPSTRKAWIGGFLTGLQQKFREQVERQQWGLVLVQPEAVVRAVAELKLGKSKRSTTNYDGDSEARYDGYTEGKRFTVNAGQLDAGNKGGTPK